LSPRITQAWNEGYKAGVSEFYPGYLAYENYSEQLEKVVEGKNMIILEQSELNDQLTAENDLYKTRSRNLIIGLAVGIPVAAGLGILAGLLLRR